MIELELNKIYQGNCLEILKEFPDNSVDCVITSPPYWGLRDYGNSDTVWGGDKNCVHQFEEIATERPNGSGGKTEWFEKSGLYRSEFTDYSDRRTYSNICKICGAWKGGLGLEPTPEMFIGHMVIIFREVRRVLKKEGTLWLNLGDSYYGGGFGVSPNGDEDFKERYPVQSSNRGTVSDTTRRKLGSLKKDLGKPKDLVGIPWRVAFALQEDGWWLRQDIIWAKPNPMPESVTDRCTKSHEYIFLLAKNKDYYFKQIMEKANYDGRNDTIHKGAIKYSGFGNFDRPQERWQTDDSGQYIRNKRDVWYISTFPYKDAHFATFPEKLVVPMIEAGCPKNGIVLDIFMGAGTTGLVARKLDRNYIGIELNTDYVKMAEKRIKDYEDQLKLF